MGWTARTLLGSEVRSPDIARRPGQLRRVGPPTVWQPGQKSSGAETVMWSMART
ncbi:hypothetical protein AB0D91_43500 [Streptomyces canus]|uniref:hypothetical protein n=1 Tax=Streptomyces canus TaxID=58343 RepID=UPI0033C5A7BC